MAETVVSTFDVAVVGLGAVGAYVVERLSAEGFSVVGIEKSSAVNPSAAYAGESRLFRAAYHEGANYVDALLYARQEWKRLHRISDRSIFLDTGVASVAPRGSAKLKGVFASLREFDLPHTALEGSEISKVFPQFRDTDGDVCIVDELGGVLRSEIAVQQLLNAAHRNGAQIMTNSEVLEVEQKGSQASISVGSKKIVAGQAIVTAGVWTRNLLPSLSKFFEIRTIPLFWFLTKSGFDFSTSNFPGFIRDKNGIHIYGFPSLDAAVVKIGAKVARETLESPDVLPLEVPASAQLDALRQITHLIDGIEPLPLRQSMHMDLYTIDSFPVVSRIDKNITIATGFSGHGFKLAPAFGRLAMDIALDRDSIIGREMYSIERF